MKENIYLDYAAATPVNSQVLDSMLPYLSQNFYNPSAIYLSARSVKKDINNARAKIAAWLGAQSYEIYFTAGATEANNIVIAGIMNQFPGGEVIVSAIEHESVLVPAQAFSHKIIKVDGSGVLDTVHLQKLISPKTVLISVMMVNNELGTTQPIKEISRIVKEIRFQRKRQKNDLPIYLHTDAAQAGNLFDLHTHRLGADLMTISGAKIYGPKQTGALFVNSDVELKPLIVGGGQEMGLRSGTENVAGFIGLSKALDMAQKIHAKENIRMNELRSFFIKELENKIPSAIVNRSKKHQSSHILSVTFPGIDNERLMMQLDEAGIQVGLGSACSASTDEPSHVLAAIDLSVDSIRSTIRFSFGRETNQSDIKTTISTLKDLV